MNNNENKNISERIRAALEARPLTVQEIKEETGVAEVSIRKVLSTAIAFGAITGRRNPGKSFLRYELLGLFE